MGAVSMGFVFPDKDSTTCASCQRLKVRDTCSSRGYKACKLFETRSWKSIKDEEEEGEELLAHEGKRKLYGHGGKNIDTRILRWGYRDKDSRARNGCNLTRVFLVKLDRSGKREHDGYGQVRYTHSASPYRSIATGGNHFPANGCFHPLFDAPCFPLTVSFTPCPLFSRAFPFYLPRPIFLFPAADRCMLMHAGRWLWQTFPLWHKLNVLFHFYPGDTGRSRFRRYFFSSWWKWQVYGENSFV